MPVKRARPPGTSPPKKQAKRHGFEHAAVRFIDDEAEEDNEVENEDEDDDGNESDHSTFSMLMKAHEEEEKGDDSGEVTVGHDIKSATDGTPVLVDSEGVVKDDEPLLSIQEKLPVDSKASQLFFEGHDLTPIVSQDVKPVDVAKPPKPEKSNWIPGRPKLNARIDKMQSFVNDRELTYSVLAVPSDARIFASDDTVRDRVHMLGRSLQNRPGTLAPVTIWIVGRLTRVYLRDNNGGLPKSVSINIRPLDPRVLHAAVTLLRRHTTDASAVDRYDDIRASRWMAVKAPGEITERIDGFDAVWDAKKALISPRDKMVPLFATDLKKGDLVLMEANLARYRIVDKNAPKETGKGKKKVDNWAAYYALKSICVLDDTPVAADPDAEAPVGSWQL